jgi:hypothetical protein
MSRPVERRPAGRVGRAVARARGARTFAYTVAGLGLINFAVWSAHHAAGYAAMGVSLLWLEYAGRRS